MGEGQREWGKMKQMVGVKLMDKKQTNKVLSNHLNYRQDPFNPDTCTHNPTKPVGNL